MGFFGKAVDCSDDRWSKQPTLHKLTEEERWAAADKRRYDAVQKLARDRGLLAMFFAATTLGATAFGVHEMQRPDVETQWIAYDSGLGKWQVATTNAKPDVPDVIMQQEATRVINCIFKVSDDRNENASCSRYIQRVVPEETNPKVYAYRRSIEGDGKLRIVQITSAPTQAEGKYTWKAAWRMEVWSKEGLIEKQYMLQGEMTFVWRQPQFNMFDPDNVGLYVPYFRFSGV